VKLLWTSSARNNLKEIITYIWHDNPAAARKIRARIERHAAYLAHQPFMGRPGAIPDTRETIPHPSYRLVYRIAGDVVFVLAVVHTSRQWPLVSED
jgi:addiction module RelE/StbE family toxin